MTAATPLNTLDFPLSGTRLIEASAGTGKTYTIAALYVRLILGHGQNTTLPARELLPPDILVVTFTDAATKELRERIRARLTQAAGYFRQQTVGRDDFLEPLCASYEPSTWPTCARRLELAANWMDESAVYTIHSWSNRMLQQHAFDSGSLFRQEVNTDDQELLNEVVRDYWRTFFYPLSEIQCLAVLKLARSPEDLINLFKSLLFETEAEGLECDNDDIAAVFKSWEEWEQKRRELEDSARCLWAGNKDEIEMLLNNASSNRWLNGNQYRQATFSNKLAAVAAWAQIGISHDINALAKFGQQSVLSGLVNAHRNQADQLQHAAFQAIDKLVSHAQQEIDITEKLTLHAIHWIRNRYDTEKQRVARMTFDDMLTRLDQALQGDNGERLASVIRQQYPIALIDEFQDTDPVQYRIFATLYPAHSDTGLGCFMIGDPKQAIYSFRGADIYTYLKAHQVTAGQHYTLGTNYRSTTALVSAVNQVFLQSDQQVEGAFRFKSDKDNPLPFISVKAKGRDDDWVINGQSTTALTMWHWETDPIGMPDYREQMSEVTASEIVRLLNLANQGQTGFKSQSGDIKPLQPSDIAILVRSGTEAKVMRNALASRQLRSVYLSERDSIYATGEAADLLIWLKAMAAPRNERKVRTALSTATLGWSYQALHQLTLDEPGWEQQLERFLGYQQSWQQDGILPTLRQLISDYRLHVRLTGENEGERCLTNLLHLAELLQQASSQLEGEQALIRHLAEAIADENNQAAEESVIRLESDANLIKIITIHKSKGLEYPLVFLPFICSFRDVSRNTYYRYHDEKQNLHIDLSKNDEIKVLSDRERLQEDLRLLYVAITRACYACWLGIAPIKAGNAKDCQLEKSAVGYLLDWQPKAPSSALAAQLTQLKGDCDAIAITELPAPDQDHYLPLKPHEELDSTLNSTASIAGNWWIASYSALQTEDKNVIQGDDYNLPNEPETAQDDKQNDETDTRVGPLTTVLFGIHSLPRGAGPGVLIHDLLEQCAYFGFQTMQASPVLRQQLIDKVFSHNAWNDKRGIIAMALTQWLTMPLLEGENVCLADLDTDHYQAELEFLIGADGVDVQILDSLVTKHTFAGKLRPRLLPAQVNGLLKGFIDLVFVHKQRYYVADYKFNGLGNDDAAYTTEALEIAMLDKRYDLQYALYLLALHRLLKARLGASYDYDTHVGGGLYLFLRGWQGPAGGRVFDKPPKVLIEGLDSLFSGSTINGEIA